jgi:hypothetical protein
MSDLDYPDCINELYQSEVLGERAFLALRSLARNERERYHFGTFLQLESETKVRLRPFLQKYDLELVETFDEEQIAGFVSLYTDNSWEGFLTAVRPLIEQFLQRFCDIAELGPPEDRATLQSMVTHEQSFLHWIDKELAGEEGALDAALSQLHYPFPAS